MSSKLKIILVVFCAFLIGGFTILVIFSVTDKSSADGNEKEKYMTTVVVDGYEFSIPNQYKATILDDMGLMYWDEEYFDMLISVSCQEYEALNEEELLQEGMTIVVPFKELAIDGRLYSYMLYRDNEDWILLCYSNVQAGVCFEAMVFCYAMDENLNDTEALERSCEEMILIADKIISTARKTDREDTAAGEVFFGQDVYQELIEEQRIDIEE